MFRLIPWSFQCIFISVWNQTAWAEMIQLHFLWGLSKCLMVSMCCFSTLADICCWALSEFSCSHTTYLLLVFLEGTVSASTCCQVKSDSFKKLKSTNLRPVHDWTFSILTPWTVLSQFHTFLLNISQIVQNLGRYHCSVFLFTILTRTCQVLWTVVTFLFQLIVGPIISFEISEQF